MIDPDLNDLLAGWFGNELPPDRAEALIDRLRTDDAFRLDFVAEIRMLGMLKAVQSPESRWLRLEDELGWSVANSPAERSLEDRVVGRLGEPAASPPVVPTPGARRWGKVLLWASSIAAGFALITLESRWWQARPLDPVPPLAVRSYPKVDTLIGLAMAVKLDGVVWETVRRTSPRRRGHPPGRSIPDRVGQGSIVDVDRRGPRHRGASRLRAGVDRQGALPPGANPGAGPFGG